MEAVVVLLAAVVHLGSWLLVDWGRLEFQFFWKQKIDKKSENELS